MSTNVEKVELDDLVETTKDNISIISKDEQMNLIKGVSVKLDVRLGASTLSIGELFRLRAGSVVALDTKTTDPVDVLFNGNRVAKGYLVVVNDSFGIQISDIAKD